MIDRIKNLKIEGFRGTTLPLELEFDDNKTIVLIFGENGTGKSTIVDAMESVGTGSTAFLDNWKLGKGKRKESYIPALGQTISDVSIDLEFGSSSYGAKLTSKGLQLCNTANRPITKVLRRKSLLTFVDADPAQRYKEVGTFLNIPQIEASEAALREALKDANKSYEQAVSANSQALENLQGLWEAEGSPGIEQQGNAVAWAKEQTTIPTEQLKTELIRLKTGVKHSETLIAQTQIVADAKEHHEQSLYILEQAIQQLDTVEAGENQSNAELITLLEDAKSYLNKSPDTLCPVCEETTIDPTELVQRLQQRIESMNALKQATVAKHKAQQTVISKQDQLSQAKEQLLNIGQGAQKHFFPELSENQSIEFLREIDKEQALEKTSQLQNQLVMELQKLQHELDSTQKQDNNLTSINHYVNTLDETSAEAKRKEVLSQRLQQALNIVENRRKSFVEGILADIAKEVDKLYQKIHPQEDIGNIKLKLDENQRGSLIYGVAFGGKQDIQPQPYYSESHLDTLGLCIFLALAKRGDTSRTLVVLDDVLVSVDQPHLQKTINMLMEETSNFAQMIITTHYRPLRNRFITSRTGTNNVQVIDLKKWQFSQGVRHATPKLSISELKTLLDNEDTNRNQIAIEAGRFLENCFDHFALLYGLRMARRPEPAYSLHELYSAVRKIKGWKIKRDISEVEIKPILDSLHDCLPVRNEVGAHYNVNGELLSDDEIINFGEITLALAEILICQNCFGMAEKQDKKEGNWVCHCKKTRMLPFSLQ